MQTNLKLSQFFQALKIFSFSRLLRKIFENQKFGEVERVDLCHPA